MVQKLPASKVIEDDTNQLNNLKDPDVFQHLSQDGRITFIGEKLKNFYVAISLVVIITYSKYIFMIDLKLN
jgi:hypothetical protein